MGLGIWLCMRGEAFHSSDWLFVMFASISRWSRGMLDGDELPGDRSGSGLGMLGGDEACPVPSWGLGGWAWRGDSAGGSGAPRGDPACCPFDVMGPKIISYNTAPSLSASCIPAAKCAVLSALYALGGHYMCTTETYRLMHMWKKSSLQARYGLLTYSHSVRILCHTCKHAAQLRTVLSSSWPPLQLCRGMWSERHLGVALLAQEVQQVGCVDMCVHPGRQVPVDQVDMVHQKVVHKGLAAWTLLHAAAADAPADAQQRLTDMLSHPLGNAEPECEP